MKKLLAVFLSLLSSTSFVEAKGGTKTIGQELEAGKNLKTRLKIKKEKAKLLLANPNRPYLCKFGAHYKSQIESLETMELFKVTPHEPEFNMVRIQYENARGEIKKIKDDLKDQVEKWPAQLKSISTRIKNAEVDEETVISIKKEKAKLLLANPNRPYLCSFGAHYQIQLRSLDTLNKIRLLPDPIEYKNAILVYREANNEIKKKKEALKDQSEKWPTQLKNISLTFKRKFFIHKTIREWKASNFIKEDRSRHEINTQTNEYSQVKFEICDLGYQGLSRTSQYDLNLPTAPVFHPYNPTDPNIEWGYTAPAFTLNLKFPCYLTHFAPAALHKHLQGMNPADIDTFLIVQDMPWKNVLLLLRPQSWLNPHAPFSFVGSYWKQFTIQTGLFSRNPNGPRITNQQKDALFQTSGIVTHNSSPNNNLIVSSGNILDIENIDINATQVVFSLTKHDSKAALVKHILLNLKDQKTFEKILGTSSNLQQLQENLQIESKNFSIHDLPNQFNFPLEENE